MLSELSLILHVHVYLIYFNRISSNQAECLCKWNFTFITSAAAIVWRICKVNNKCRLSLSLTISCILTFFLNSIFLESSLLPKKKVSTIYNIIISKFHLLLHMTPYCSTYAKYIPENLEAILFDKTLQVNSLDTFNIADKNFNT